LSQGVLVDVAADPVTLIQSLPTKYVYRVWPAASWFIPCIHQEVQMIINLSNIKLRASFTGISKLFDKECKRVKSNFWEINFQTLKNIQNHNQVNSA
jgi:hypothetical protein